MAKKGIQRAKALAGSLLLEILVANIVSLLILALVVFIVANGDGIAVFRYMEF